MIVARLHSKRFKNLREKIKHAILDRKKEKYRIIMDATLHKIPHGLRVSKDQNYNTSKHQSVKPKKSGKHSSRSGCQSDQLGLISGTSPLEHFKRTSSFNESLDRYNRLMEISCNREAKEHVYERLRLRQTDSLSPVPSRPATLGRILSLPDLRSYCSFQIDDSPSTSPFNTSDSGLTQYFLFQYEEDIDDTNNTLGNQAKQLYKESLLDAKDLTELNYVKHVLELSGFSENQILGKLHSQENLVDPSVFDEVQGQLVSRSENTTNEAGVTCDHLLLFNLINEVLLHIYENFFFYWSTPLTCQSRMHTRPFGRHVLDHVWTEISSFLNWNPEFDQTIDDVVSRDLAKDDGWMNLQSDAERVGIGVEDLIFDDLHQKIIFT